MTSQNWSIAFQNATLDLTKFDYVPIPDGLVIDIPSTNGTGSSGTPMDPPVNASDACYECIDTYKACKNNTECVAGVNSYFWAAIQPSQFAAPEYFPGTNGVGIFRTDLSAALRGASAAFSPSGYAALLQSVSCLAASGACEVSYPTAVTATDGSTYVPDPSYLNVDQAQLELTVPAGAMFTVSSSKGAFTFTENANPEALRVFFQDLIMGDSAIVRVETAAAASTTAMPLAAYVVTFEDYFGELPVVYSSAIPTTVNYQPWRLFVETKATTTAAQTPVPSWSKLLAWFAPLVSTTSSSSSSSNYNNNNNNNNNTADTICKSCQVTLATCLMDTDCASGVRSYVVPFLTSASVTSSLSGSQIEYQGNLTWVLTEASQNFNTVAAWGLFTNVLSCVSTARCDVGYDGSNATTLRVDDASIEFFLDDGADLTVLLNGQQYQYHESQGIDVTDLSNFFQEQVFQNFPGVSVGVTASLVSADGELTKYAVTIHQYFGVLPAIIVSSPSNTEAVTVDSWSISTVAYGHEPSTDRLASWLSIKYPTSYYSPAATLNCQNCNNVLASCQADASCFNALQWTVNQALVDNAAAFVAKPSADGSRQEIDVTSAFTSLVLDALDATTKVQLMQVFRCVAASNCLSDFYPTEHTGLQIIDATQSFAVPKGATFDVAYDGFDYTFTETGNAQYVQSFLGQTLLGSPVNVALQATPTASGLVAYQMTYNNWYTLGKMPHLSYGTTTSTTSGQSVDSDWRMVFTSDAMYRPTWDGLLGWLGTLVNAS